MLRKNDVVTVTIESLGAEGEGVARFNGMAVFLKYALPGETVRAKIIKVDKRFAIGRVEEILSSALERRPPPCPVYARCGGCAMQHMAYEATLAAKRQRVIDCIERIGHVRGVTVHPVLGMADPFRYRNKGAIPIGGTWDAPRIGFYAPRSHDIVDAPGGCLLQRMESDKLAAALREWIITYRIPPYDEVRHTGLLRHLVTRVTRAGDTMATLVINGETIPHAEALIETFRTAVPSLTGILLSPNTQRTNVIFGDTVRPLWGEETLVDTLCGLSFELSAKSFFQVNPEQAEQLYRVTLAYAALTGTETVADAYCGAGTITLLLARACAKAVGVEIVPEAVRNARANALRNGVTNAVFYEGAAEEVLPRLVQEWMKPDVWVMDPPRKGCDIRTLEAAAKTGPRRIVYVSCDPATLARDACQLHALGYKLLEVQPVDLFCWSAGIECAALFVQANG